MTQNKDLHFECNDDSFDCPQGIDLDGRKLLLQKIIDGQATTEEEKTFYHSMKNCEACKCKNICEQHLEIKAWLKEKLNPKPLPHGLIEDIRNKISGSI